MIGQQIGHYAILSKLGEGGMGEVYRARDHKLGRDVALKILPTLVSGDPERLARFRREAQVLASLNHPNIAQIYGFEDTGPTQALVLELVEGPTLADRIAAGPLPIEEALAIARQIADAVAVAHESGIVHRDLKPANIKLKDALGPGSSATMTGGYAVKVLDFGLAKALSGDSGSGASPVDSPTLTARGTQPGVILGTAAYMAPEQARGRSADRRADLWAFGVVLYEMLTGRRAFDGPEISDVLAAVLRDMPPLDRLPSDTPPSVRRLLRRTLEKDPGRRLDSIAAARLELDDVETAPAVSAGARKPTTRGVIFAAAASVVAALGAGAAVWYAMRPPPPSTVRLALTASADQPFAVETNHGDIAITPDGSHIVYLTQIGQDSQDRSFVVRSLDQPEGRVLARLPANVRGQFISPDGRWIGFQTGQSPGGDNEVRKVPIDGGASILICGVNFNLRGASWAPDDTIVFATANPAAGLMRVNAAGGTPEVLTRPDPASGEADHLWPQHLPGGRYVLFAIRRTDGSWDSALLSLETKTWRVLIKDALSSRYVTSGHLVYAASTGIRAVAFDLDRLEVRGDPVEVQPGVVTKESGAADFAVSENGTLVYMPGQYYSLAETLAWREPDGRETPLRVPAQPFTSLRISPDGRQAVAGVGRATSSGFWLIDLIRETSLRLTQDDMVITFPVWAPDGRQIAYGIAGRADAREPGGLFRLTVTGTGVPERLTTAPENSRHAPGGWTPDGRQLVFGEGGPRDADIKLLTHGSPPTVTTILGGPAVEWQPALSPDGRWLAYALIDSVSEVFVRPFPNVNDARIPVSAGPGGNPLWGPEGRELYFTRAGDVYVVTVEAGQPISFGKPKLLMALRSEGPEPIRVALPPVKGRVLKTVREVRTAARPTEYRVVLNWLEELKTRLPAR